MILLDTHVLVWLYAGLRERFANGALHRLRTDDLAISPMVTLELTYLHGIGRTDQPGQVVVDDLARRLGLRVVDASLASVAAAAAQLGWTRDPFDRMICAQALMEKIPLMTADRTIHEHLDLAVWD